MIKMAAMAINSKDLKLKLKLFFSRTRRPMILKLCMKHQGEELYEVCIDDLDIFYNKVNIGRTWMYLNGENC